MNSIYQQSEALFGMKWQADACSHINGIHAFEVRVSCVDLLLPLQDRIQGPGMEESEIETNSEYSTP